MKASKCGFTDCKKKVEHRHHVTYRPPVIVGLCRSHHEDITIINTNATEETRRKLTNAQRWFLWRQWLSGEVKPVRSIAALAWIAKWDKPKKKFFKRLILLEEIVARKLKLVKFPGSSNMFAPPSEEVSVNPIFVIYVKQSSDDGITTLIMANKEEIYITESFNTVVEKLMAG